MTAWVTDPLRGRNGIKKRIFAPLSPRNGTKIAFLVPLSPRNGIKICFLVPLSPRNGGVEKHYLLYNMKYGLPYKGSKNKLAEKIIHLLPKADHLYDLFCGGCAVSHAALVMGKYQHVHINDVNWMCPTLFVDALNGKYNDETRWISREDFDRLKDTDPYVAVVWSFGNNLRDYLYSREIEPLKKAIHYAMFFHDYSLGLELGHDLSFIEPIKDLQKRYLAIKHYFEGKMNDRMQSFEGGAESRIAAGILQPNDAPLSIPTFRIGGGQ